MNKIAIVAGICGLAVGAIGGYSVCHYVEEKKVDKRISDEIQKTLAEIKSSQKRKIIENEELKKTMINTTPHLNNIDIAKNIAIENGYTKKIIITDKSSSEETKKDVKVEAKEPDEAPDEDLPFDIPTETDKDYELYKKSIWDADEEDPNAVTQEEYDDEQEPDIPIDVSKVNPSEPPYVITKQQYDEEFMDATSEGMWSKVDLIFFTDNVFAERAALDEFTVMSSVEVELAIGKDNMKHFIEDRSLGRVFIRNNKLHIDYNIIRSPRSYSSALHEDDEE